ncbi:MAG: NAD(P)/FAD-dependent oxidoreductase [Acidimicrobiia bacterium]|nr:NAD(P)/FAD-dependent oxidoreductase [Acidimicrobiia bacterium]MDH5504270.1 NAD(P)/FAD-dependent oxidoreductase [Acidimicrobiia bacterium]
MADYDFVIAGAGHNSLITAAYLAKAGYACVVLDAREIPGGGASTEEILGPGYWVDTCSTGHTLIQVNPLIRNDELGLVSKYGLRYVDPDPVAQVAFPDGEPFTMWLDFDKTCAEIARFSEKDADAYRRLVTEYDEVKSLIGQVRFRPVGFGPSTEDLLAAHPRGEVWQRRSMMTAREVILREFESPHMRAFMAWISLQTAVPLDAPGSGILAYSLVSARQARSWSLPVGGSGQLIDALVGFLEDAGAEILCNRMVSELILEGGRCVGVRTTDGEEFRGSKGVVSTIHVKRLLDMAPAESWGEGFTYGVETFHPGTPFFAGYFATTAPPVFPTPDGGRSAVSAGLAPWIEDAVQHGRDVYDGKFVTDPGWLLVATPTLVDRGRAPEGTHTVKMVTFNTYDADGQGPHHWDEIKEAEMDKLLDHFRKFVPTFTDDLITARLVKSPLDFERMNPHMVGGTPHGGDRGLIFSGSQRPAPGWAQHRLPIDGLYQTGGTTHPGGSITGAPGRNAAMVILQDLGTTIEAVL